MKGHIHSIESFGTVDGPGIRLVVFFKGCPMRCQYCHNPDTWEMSGGTEMEAEEIIAQFQSAKAYYKNGGITASGGEPMVQIDFLIHLFQLAKENQIHTCLDTSGVTFRPDNQEYLSKLDKLLAVTDLVMLDIKHIDPEEHEKLCAQPNGNILAFARYLDQKNIPVWIRHVAVPGITFKREPLYRLGRFIGGLSNVKALDVLPYHDMGKVKYERLGIPYPLADVPPLSKEEAKQARAVILQGIRDFRGEKQQ
ncbi:pyruvate formate-lyase-activating protein [Lachnoclostridium edouardi]|uniref:pyruvate formate-lyase-activating protein n=1 Tax=Lachnoclostridium edouardi TaxID=1926283 RepID=UPI000C7B6444|nr:pyruvate formate-lyase-activating protein [Lachnoclostridium edouardi]